MKRSPLRRCSRKRERELKEYSKMRKWYLSENDVCAMLSCDNPATDIHHVKGRGKHLNDITTWMAVCRSCHTFIHNNPSLARAHGWLAK